MFFTVLISRELESLNMTVMEGSKIDAVLLTVLHILK